MAEPTLALTYDALAGQVGFFLGFGFGDRNGDSAWQPFQKQQIDFCIQEGYRQFVNPPIIPGEHVAYDWSFMRPVTDLTLTSGTRSVRLPDDFAAAEGRITVAPSGNTTLCPWDIAITGEERIRHMVAQNPSRTGRPEHAAIEWLKGTTATTGQRCELTVFPQADADYTLELSYYVNPDALDPSKPFAYGGAAHASTIQASCLAAAEKLMDDSVGVKEAIWKERLAASISADRKIKAQLIGYNDDRSDMTMRNRRNRYGGIRVSYNGVYY